MCRHPFIPLRTRAIRRHAQGSDNSARVSSLSEERGVTLAAVIITALIFAIAAFALLNMVLSQVQRAEGSLARQRAAYAAESGLVWATQRLCRDPNYPSAGPSSTCITPSSCTTCNTAGSQASDRLSLDTDGNGSLETQVNITVTNCGPNRLHTLSARVTY